MRLDSEQIVSKRPFIRHRVEMVPFFYLCSQHIPILQGLTNRLVPNLKKIHQKVGQKDSVRISFILQPIKCCEKRYHQCLSYYPPVVKLLSWIYPLENISCFIIVNLLLISHNLFPISHNASHSTFW